MNSQKEPSESDSKQQSSIEYEARLFDQACELPAAERKAFLDRHCAGRDSLRGRLEALLAADQAAGAGLDTPALASLRHVLPEREFGPEGQPESPKNIGPYRIIGVLGRGGMGVVYEAEQSSPARRVALKIVRPGLVSEALLRRFEHEATVLGWLSHPGIAQIYEAGTAMSEAGPQPYFAMELIRGKTLSRYMKSQPLSLEARLELLAKICDAVHHAHQKGVIHRDLKPANVLVDENGQPKIVDFGVARVTNRDLQATTLSNSDSSDPTGPQTAVGELVGTLTYMSPEQVSGQPDEVDTRSDMMLAPVGTKNCANATWPKKTKLAPSERKRTLSPKRPRPNR